MQPIRSIASARAPIIWGSSIAPAGPRLARVSKISHPHFYLPLHSIKARRSAPLNYSPSSHARAPSPRSTFTNGGVTASAADLPTTTSLTGCRGWSTFSRLAASCLEASREVRCVALRRSRVTGDVTDSERRQRWPWRLSADPGRSLSDGRQLWRRRIAREAGPYGRCRRVLYGEVRNDER